MDEESCVSHATCVSCNVLAHATLCTPPQTPFNCLLSHPPESFPAFICIAELAAVVRGMDFDSYSTAPACTYTGAGLPDKLGRKWGYQNGKSCAFHEAAAAAAAPDWDKAKECSYKLTDTNSLTDKVGRRWGYEGGTSCAFKTQILSTVAPRPPPGEGYVMVVVIPVPHEPRLAPKGVSGSS
jgi:hypothetical protein